LKQDSIERWFTGSIRTRLFFVVLVILIGSYAMFGYQQSKKITTVIEKDALEKAQSDLNTGWALIDALYPGDWQVKDGMLYKGETLMNDNHELVDLIGRLTNGDTATIFLGDVRVATNVILEDGQRAIGSKASSIVAEKVLQNGEIYLGNADVVRNTYQTAYMPIRDSGGQVIGMWYVGAPDADARISELKNEMMIRLSVEGAVIFVIAFLLFFVATHALIKRIQTSSKIVQAVAGGDLTVGVKQETVKSKDETGTLLESVYKMTRDLRGMVGQVKETSSLIAASSVQLSASTEQMNQAVQHINHAIQEVASGTDEQMNNVTESTEAVHGISRGMDQVAEAIQHMAEYSSKVNEDAHLGTEVVARSIEYMDQVKRSFENVSSMILSLETRSKEIEAIADMITEIADQTHLLALNASIEAARAGEHGEGFAVVAAEVRKLADQSADSAEKVSRLIRQIRSEADKAVSAVSEGSKVMEQGLVEVRQSGNAFRNIANAIGEISSQSQEASVIAEQVHLHSHETAAKMNRMAEILSVSAKNIQNIAAALEEQHASIEEIASAFGHLRKMADGLQLLTNQFKL